MIYRTLFQGSRFRYTNGPLSHFGVEFTKVGNAYAIDDEGNEHIPSLFDKVVPVKGEPSPFLDMHLGQVNFRSGTFMMGEEVVRLHS